MAGFSTSRARASSAVSADRKWAGRPSKVKPRSTILVVAWMAGSSSTIRISQGSAG